MCFMNAPRPAPAPTPPPTRDSDSEELRKREAEDRKRLRLSQGRRATILTSGMGASDFDEAGGRAVLLGQSRPVGTLRAA